jgi:hypothetical protein
LDEVARPIFLLFLKSWSNGVENCDVSCNPDAPTRDSASAEVCVYYSAWTYRNRCVGVNIYYCSACIYRNRCVGVYIYVSVYTLSRQACAPPRQLVGNCVSLRNSGQHPVFFYMGQHPLQVMV